MITIKDDQYILDFSHKVPVDSAIGRDIAELCKYGAELNNRLWDVPESEGFILAMIVNQALVWVDS